ncbi:hypothetical protein WOC76_06995 [Methylocystis sp. IM3]|uniref:hypothetical protein n=1 Tax=unclassified Methylocystis TaxID=2625913 RepID=UPI0030F6D738
MVSKKLQRAINKQRKAFDGFFNHPDIDCLPHDQAYRLSVAEECAARKIATMEMKSDAEFLHALRYLTLRARKIWGDPDNGFDLSDVAVLIEQYLGLSDEEAEKVFGDAGEAAPGAAQIAA